MKERTVRKLVALTTTMSYLFKIIIFTAAYIVFTTLTVSVPYNAVINTFVGLFGIAYIAAEPLRSYYTTNYVHSVIRDTRKQIRKMKENSGTKD